MVGESKTSPRRITVALRRAQALEMRKAGASYPEIVAAGLGYKSTAAAAQDVQRAMLAVVAEPAAEVRALELMRLDELWVAALAVLKRDHITVSNGKVIYSPGADGKDKPLLDDGPVLNAIDRLLRIQERRAKYLGLDAPTKVEVITDDAIDREIQHLAAELERTAAAQAAEVEGTAG